VGGAHPDMPSRRFSKFTRKYHEALSHAQREMSRHRQTKLASEHLLLGILDVGGGVAITALAKLGIRPEMLRTAVEDCMETWRLRTTGPTGGTGGFTPDAMQSLEYAATEAESLEARGPHYLGAYRERYIGTEHLFLGILRVAERNEWSGTPTIAGDALRTCQVSYDTAYNAVCQCLLDLAALRR
jgi:ATP-dependent Clp protease ATP-binding subunit ClpC